MSIPTVGIGAGLRCDGQVLVFHDLLRLYNGLRPKFVKCYAELASAIRAYRDKARGGTFPGPEHESK